MQISKEKHHTSATNVSIYPLQKAALEVILNPQRRKIKQMQPMQLCIFSSMRFEETFENAEWRKAKQMQPGSVSEVGLLRYRATQLYICQPGV